MRALIDLPDSQILALAALCERVKQSRTALIREAVAEYLERRATKPTEAAHGLWGAETMDGVAYQNKARSEWRPL